MTDNEIIKALECCSKNCCNYKECLYSDNELDCVETLTMDALDLINRQKAEIEKLNKQVFYVPARANGKSMLVRMTLKSIADEAIKKFAEKLKESAFDVDVSFGYGKECYDKAVAVIEIDNLVKERVGDDNEMQNAEVD